MYYVKNVFLAKFMIKTWLPKRYAIWTMLMQKMLYEK